MNKTSKKEMYIMQALCETGLRYLARDNDGSLYGFTGKPVKQDGDWNGDGPLLLVGALFSDEFRWIPSDAEEPFDMKAVVHPVLKAREARYLENLLRPFEERVTSVSRKATEIAGYEHLVVDTEDAIDGIGVLSFPPFKAGKAYEGMELGRQYTLDELGLFQ